MSFDLSVPLQNEFVSRCTQAGIENAKAFLASSNNEVLQMLFSGTIPPNAIISSGVDRLGITEDNFRKLCAEFWLVSINSINLRTVGAGAIDPKQIQDYLRAKKREIANYFFLGSSVHYWDRGRIRDYLTSDDCFYAAMKFFLIFHGCRSFASLDELNEAIIREQWSNWQEWVADSQPN